MGPNARTPRVTIVGGGFTGASVAVQLVRASPVAIEATIVEPRLSVGAGLHTRRMIKITTSMLRWKGFSLIHRTPQLFSAGAGNMMSRRMIAGQSLRTDRCSSAERTSADLLVRPYKAMHGWQQARRSGTCGIWRRMRPQEQVLWMCGHGMAVSARSGPY